MTRRVKKPAIAYVVTCEHGGNLIPRAYAHLFRGRRRLLATHRGFDAGALSLARSLARALGAPLIASTTSRLLVELNRSPDHPELFSPPMRSAPEKVRAEVFRRFYVPYRRAVEAAVRDAAARGLRVVHVSAHSFTPVLRGVVRRIDVGLLYDPRRPRERSLCDRWDAALRARAPRWRVRRNQPYRGTDDGLTTWLRERFADADYAGIEVEVNQKRVRAGQRTWRATRATIVNALLTAVD
jgi:predicted N-formylglutamate amidohydrolase